MVAATFILRRDNISLNSFIASLLLGPIINSPKANEQEEALTETLYCWSFAANL